MAFQPLTGKARRDPLGFAHLNQLAENLRRVEQCQLVEHTADGEHNALEVARAVALVEWNGSAYSLTTSSPGISLNSRDSAGVILFDLNTDLFPGQVMVRITIVDDATEGVPFLHTYELDGSKLKVRLFKLASLGGNSWAPADGDFVVAVHSMPVASTGTPVLSIQSWSRGKTLGYERWNQAVENSATLRERMLACHKANGQHNVLEVARGYARVTWSGTSFAVPDSRRVSKASLIGPGVCRLTRESLPLPVLPFAAAGYDTVAGSPYDMGVVCFPLSEMVADDMDAYLYRYNPGSNTWSRANFDFSVSLHIAAE